MRSKVALIKSIASDVVQQLQDVCITNPDFVAQVEIVLCIQPPCHMSTPASKHSIVLQHLAQMKGLKCLQ
jgi:hypothetical protein